MDVYQAFAADVAAGPQWVYWWVNFMGIVLMLAIPFAFVRAEARWAVLVIALTFPSMMWLYAQVGYVLLLGLIHVIIWTPYVVYLWMRRDRWRVSETISGKWIALLFATMIVSLAFDYTDVIRYALGERG